MNINILTKFKLFSYVTQVIVMLYLALLLANYYKINTLQNNLNDAQENAHYSKKLANDLLQSSEDLTRMARSYVATGNQIYKKAFYAVLNIRNGEAPRPKKYSATYWHLYYDSISNAASKNTSSKISLRALMLNAHFTNAEILLLDKSKTLSDKLTLIEQKAFAIVDKSIGENGLKLTNSQYRKAVALVYNDNYTNAKKSIMMPISKVIDSIDNRTAEKISQIQSQIAFYLNLLWILITLGIIGTIVMFLITKKYFITPLSDLSHTDTLTGTLNRRGIVHIVTKELARYRRTGASFSLLMIDIDFFKKINDTYGHTTGDKALKRFTSELFHSVRTIDYLGRWGGEEFVVILPGLEYDAALCTAERLRKIIEQSEMHINKKTVIKMTVSIGISSVDNSNDTLKDIIKLADERLYKAKRNGRNKVCPSFEDRGLKN